MVLPTEFMSPAELARDYGGSWSNRGIVFKQVAPGKNLIRAMCDCKCHLTYDQLKELGNILGDKLLKPITNSMSKADILYLIAYHAFGEGTEEERNAYARDVLKRDEKPKKDMDVDELTEYVMGFMDPEDKDLFKDVESKLRARRRQYKASHQKWQEAKQKRAAAQKEKKAKLRKKLWRKGAGKRKDGNADGKGKAGDGKGIGKGGKTEGKGKGGKDNPGDMESQDAHGRLDLGRADRQHKLEPWGDWFKVAYRPASSRAKGRMSMMCSFHRPLIRANGVKVRCQRNLDLQDDTPEEREKVKLVLYNWAMHCLHSDIHSDRKLHMDKTQFPLRPAEESLLTEPECVDLRNNLPPKDEVSSDADST